jgi:hypothetical protein
MKSTCQNNGPAPLRFRAPQFALSALFLALLPGWLACLSARAAVQTVTIQNDTGQTANNLEIVFSQPLDVGNPGNVVSKTAATPFTLVTESGLTPNEYTFKGGSVAPGNSATVSWSPGGTIVSGYWSQTIPFTNAVKNIGLIHLAPAPVFANIPVVINIHTNSPMTTGNASNAIAQASTILMQAGFKLTIVKLNTNFSGNGTDTNGNYDSFDLGNTNAWMLVSNAINVLSSNMFTMGKGIVIDFLSNADWSGGSNYSPGWSIHRQPVVVTMERGDTNADGQTIAHEIGHILTLAGHNLIGVQGTNPIYATGGHAPNIPGTNGQGNFMAPSNYRTNAVITPAQKTEMNKGASNIVASLAGLSPDGTASVVELQRGSGFFATAQNPAYPRYDYVESANLVSANGDNNIFGQIQLYSTLAPGAWGVYALALDTDNDPTTGEDLGPYPGIEYVVLIYFDWPTTNPAPILSGEGLDLESSQETPLCACLTNEDMELDSTDALSTIVGQTILFTLPKDLLGLPSIAGPTPWVIPVGVFTEDYNADATIFAGDMFPFNLYEWESWPQLSVTLNSAVTRQFTFSGSGLTPNSNYQLYVDGTGIGAGTIPVSGQIQGQFSLNPKLSMMVPHFVTAQDATGLFAWSLTPPVPPQLAINRLSNGGFRISWQTPWQPYFPQTTPSLAPNGIWYLVGGQTWQIGGNSYVDLPNGLPPQFIQLSTAVPPVPNNTIQGPYYLINNTSGEVDGFQATFTGSGETLNYAQMAAGPSDAVIGALGNQVNIVFPTPLQPGTTFGFTVNSQTPSIAFSNGLFTFQGQIVGAGSP